MKNPYTIVFFLGLGLLSIVVARFTFLAWCDPDKLRSISIEGIEHLPKWFPLRTYFVSYYKQSVAYIWFARIMLAIAAIALILLVALTLYRILII